MKFLKKVLKIVYNKNTKDDWDTVWIIDGDEGNSKSTLALWILDWWLHKLNGKIEIDDVKHMCMTSEMFKQDLADLKKFECTVFDEAGELSNRRTMAKFNYDITQAYKVIRGDNLFTLLVLPSVFDIDSYFSKRRVRGLIHVYGRGKFAFWSKNRLRNMVDVNATRWRKNHWVVAPTYNFGRFNKYKGLLKIPYDLLKHEKMEETRKKLIEDINKEKKKKEINKPRVDMEKLLVQSSGSLKKRRSIMDEVQNGQKDDN